MKLHTEIGVSENNEQKAERTFEIEHRAWTDSLAHLTTFRASSARLCEDGTMPRCYTARERIRDVRFRGFGRNFLFLGPEVRASGLRVRGYPRKISHRNRIRQEQCIACRSVHGESEARYHCSSLSTVDGTVSPDLQFQPFDSTTSAHAGMGGTGGPQRPYDAGPDGPLQHDRSFWAETMERRRTRRLGRLRG